MTTQTKAGNPSPGNRIVLYTMKKSGLIHQITDTVDDFLSKLIYELTVLIKDVELEGQRIDWTKTEYVSEYPEYLKWSAAAIETALGERHPDIPEDIAADLQATLSDLTGHLNVQDLEIHYDEDLQTWRLHFREMGLESALLNEMGLPSSGKPISLFYDILSDTPDDMRGWYCRTFIPTLNFLDTDDVERYYEILQRTWKPALTWLQFRSSNDNQTDPLELAIRKARYRGTSF